MLDLEIIFILGSISSILVLAYAPIAVIYAAALVALLPGLGVTLWLILRFLRSTAARLNSPDRTEERRVRSRPEAAPARDENLVIPELPIWTLTAKSYEKEIPVSKSAPSTAEPSETSSEAA